MLKLAQSLKELSAVIRSIYVYPRSIIGTRISANKADFRGSYRDA